MAILKYVACLIFFKGLNHLIRTIDNTGDVSRKSGSGRPRCVRTDGVVDQVADLVLTAESGRSAVPLLTETDLKASWNISHVCQQNH